MRVQCGATAKSTGERCRNSGTPADDEGASSHYFCRYHVPSRQTCQGKRNDGLPCGSLPKFGSAYCGAAHDPASNYFKPAEFRNDWLPVSCRDLLVTFDRKDAYTGEMLRETTAHRDHVIECQMAAHVCNAMFKAYNDEGRDVDAITSAVPIVTTFVNAEANLVPIHQDINVLKGAGIKSFLDETTLRGDALWTSHLCDAHSQLSRKEAGSMAKKRLDRRVTGAITDRLAKSLRVVETAIDGESDNETMRRLGTRFHQLRVRITST